MKYKTYSKNNDLTIREMASLFVERVEDGIYYVIKNRQGDYDKFITSHELVEELNSVHRTAVAVQSEDGITLYSGYLDDLDKEIMYRASLRDKNILYRGLRRKGILVE